jgi:hypothetical protein
MTKDILRTVVLAAGFALVPAIAFAICGDGVVDSGEQCDLGGANGSPTSCCTTLCEYRSAGLTCRANADTCDVPETCTGTSEFCPADAFQPTNFQCRPAAGLCDQAELCSGSGPTCPPDVFRPSGSVCRAPVGNCDLTENCDGTGPNCPADTFEPSGTVCRPATGDCDVTETCTGGSGTCPADARQPSGFVCRPGNGVCDPAETCNGTAVACPADAFAPDGTACTDNSACTDNDACFRGVCVGVASVDACLDDFLCYKAKLTSGQTFAVIPNVNLVDQFEDVDFDVIRPRNLCLPADKNQEGTVDTTTHLESYSIRAVRGSPRHTPQTNLLVTNQLGFIRVDTIRPDLLLVPAAKSLVSQPPAPNPTSHNVDHYKCYKVRVTRGTPRFPERVIVTATDQFNVALKTVKLKKPRHLCTPVDKNGEGIKNPTVHLMCYLGSGQPKTPKHEGVFVTDQFGARRLNTIREKELCIPSLKTVSSPSGAFLDGDDL